MKKRIDRIRSEADGVAEGELVGAAVGLPVAVGDGSAVAVGDAEGDGSGDGTGMLVDAMVGGPVEVAGDSGMV